MPPACVLRPENLDMRVLLIEDDVTTSAKIEVNLQNEGIVCDVAHLGEKGLEQGKLYDYDIIVLDLLLPDMDGYEVLRRLRAAKVRTLAGFLLLAAAALSVLILLPRSAAASSEQVLYSF